MTPRGRSPAPPQNLEAEESVLGAMLLSPSAIDAVAEEVSPEDFYRASHGKIYRTIGDMHAAGGPVDALILVDTLEKRGELEDVGGRVRIHELAALVPATANAAHYARIVRETATLRALIQAGLEITRLGTERPGETPQLIHRADNILQTIRARQTTPPQPIAVTLHQLLQQPDEHTTPLLGTETDTILPQGGLALLAGQAGIGKTTLAIDLACHLATGKTWLGLPVPNPLQILLVENEGPPQKFKQKLREKTAGWEHPQLQTNIHVKTVNWGTLNLTVKDDRQHLTHYLETHAIDVMIGDPLESMGIQGVGSPEDTRNFLTILRDIGLMETRAFLFLHHFRKEISPDEIDQVRGAWGGHLDTLLILKPTRRKDEQRLSFPKLRWAKERPALIIGRIHNTASFEVIGEEGDARLLEPELADKLAGGAVLTTTELAAKDTGVGARREAVKTCLDGNPHLFERVADPKSVGRSVRAECWRLLEHGDGTRGSSGSSSEGAGVPGNLNHPPTPLGVGGSSSNRGRPGSREAPSGGVGGPDVQVSADEELAWR